MLERLINHIRSFPNVEFMRVIDVAEMWGGGELSRSADDSMENP